MKKQKSMEQEFKEKAIILSGEGAAEFDEEELHDIAKCGYKKVDGDLDIFDRDRNPIGGIRESSGFQNRNQVQMDWDAQDRKDDKKRAKIAKSSKGKRGY